MKRFERSGTFAEWYWIICCLRTSLAPALSWSFFGRDARCAPRRRSSRCDGSVRTRMASLVTLLSEESSSSLLRVGWIHDAVDWVEQATGDRICSISELEQLNAGANFALIRFPMQSGRSYWLKATAHPNSHEQAITLYLSQLCPGCVPDVLAVHPSWNAWIVPDNSVNDWQFPSNPTRRLRHLDRAVGVMATIQWTKYRARHRFALPRSLRPTTGSSLCRL